MNVKVVRLDTKEARNRAMNGKNFQIKTVPALMILYEDGNMQLFVGREKIMYWLQQSIRPPSPVNKPEFAEESSEEEYIPIKQHKKKASKKSESKGLYSGSSKKDKRKKAEAVVESEEEEEIIFIDNEEEESKPPPPFTKGLITGAGSKAKSNMSSIMKDAKQMERDRQNSLGYDESKLPAANF